MKPIYQSESTECGLACLTMVANHHGLNTSLQELRSLFPKSLKGCNLGQLMQDANSIHLASRPVRLDISDLSSLRLPAILHWDLSHFVVLKKITRKRRSGLCAVINDPARGEVTCTAEEISQSFTGVALEVTPTPGFSKRPPKEITTIGELTGPIDGLRRALVTLLSLALALELFVLLTPLLNQFIIDDVVVSADVDLLNVLGLGFIIVLSTQHLIMWARSWLLLRWSTEAGFHWSARVFSHLVCLPTTYFEKRYLGDIVSRFGSVARIQQTVTTISIEGVLDGIMAIVSLGMLMVYSPLLTAIVLTSLLSYTILRLSSYYRLREASGGLIVMAARQESHFLESIRAIVPIKLFGRESHRTTQWLNMKQDTLNSDLRTQQIGIEYRCAGSFITGMQNLAILYFGAKAVIAAEMTVGMMMAFLSYASTFSSRTVNLINLFMDAKILEVHKDRLADITKAEVDATTVETGQHVAIDDPTITFENVSFRYAEGEPWVLQNASFEIPYGKSIALVGPSGGGKTTLCKLILGLFPPTSGNILINGISINKVGGKAYRSLVGSVLQDDCLLQGTIHDNISFFDPSNDFETVEHCAHLAAVHDEIISMPMGYRTIVGEMGSCLSGGQKQRVFLARALYKRPRILVLDEATSHLDIPNEARVSASLVELKLTRIIVAHRIETIRTTEMILVVDKGKVTPAARKSCSEK